MVIIIPAHNESEMIGEVIRSLREQRPRLEIIVVDDASTDGTAEFARAAGALVLPLSIQLGAWGATQAGMRHALHAGHRALVTMDADGQHPADQLDSLTTPLARGEADVVIGACPERGNAARRLAWRLFKWLTGLKIEDLTSGFRAYNHRAIELLASPQATLLQYQDIGVLMLLRSAGLNITETEVSMCRRKSGRSRIFHSWLAVTYYLAHTVVLCLAKWTPTSSHTSKRAGS